jgi:TonB family protein
LSSEPATETEPEEIEEVPSLSAASEALVFSAGEANETAEETLGVELRALDFDTELLREPEPSTPLPQSFEVFDFGPQGGLHETEQQILAGEPESRRKWRRTAIIAALVSLAVLGVAAGMRWTAPQPAGAPDTGAGVENPPEGPRDTNRATNRATPENPHPFLVEVLDVENRRWVLWFPGDAHENVPGGMGHDPILTGVPSISKAKTVAKQEPARANRKLDGRLGLILPIVGQPRTKVSATNSALLAAPAIPGETAVPFETLPVSSDTIGPPPVATESSLPVGGDVQPARLVRAIPPVYPQMAKANHIAGDVALDALIDASGNVRDVNVISGPVLLQEAAKEAVRQWKYEPTRLDGKPTAIHLTVTVKFRVN